MNRKEIAVGFGWNAAFNGLNRAVFPILGIIIARIMGPAQMGAYSVLAMIFSLADIFREAGIGASYVSDSDDSAENEGEYTLLSVLVGLALGLVVLLSIPIIKGFLSGFQDLTVGLAIVALSLVVNGLGTIPAAKLQRQAKFREAGTAEFASNAISYGITLPLILLGAGFNALVLQMLLKVGCNALLLARAARPLKLSRSLAAAGQKLRSTASVLTNNILYSVYTMADNLAVGKLLGQTATGLYAVSYNLALKPLDLVSFPLGRTLFVAFTRSTADKAELARRFVKSLAAVTLFSCPIYGFGILYGPSVIASLYGEEYRAGGAAFQFLCCYLFARSLGSLAGSVMIAMRRTALANLCWLPAFLVAGTGIWLNREHLSVTVMAAWISAGAVCVYSLSLAAALIVLKPELAEFRRWAVAAAVGAATLACAAALRLLPGTELARLLIAASVTALLHLIGIGIAFAGRPFECLTLRGLRRLAKI